MVRNLTHKLKILGWLGLDFSLFLYSSFLYLLFREKLFTLSRDNTQQRSLTLSCISSNNVETKFLACVKLYSIKKKNKSQAKQVKKKETQTDQVVTTSTTDGLLMVYWKYNMVTVHTHTHKHTKLALLNV